MGRSFGRVGLLVAIGISGAIAGGAEDGVGVLFEEPLEEVAIAVVGLDGGDGVVGVAQFAVAEGAVDEAFAGLAGGHDDAPALGLRHDVVAAREDVAAAEDTHEVKLPWEGRDASPSAPAAIVLPVLVAARTSQGEPGAGGFPQTRARRGPECVDLGIRPGGGFDRSSCGRADLDRRFT